MELQLYDTLTRKKRVFTPIDPARVRMYVCGPTVYDFAHIGNARPVIVFDVLFRLLRKIYGTKHVKYVRNITDVDDKINARAGEEYPNLPLNEAIRQVTKVTEKQFHDDVDALGCLRPNVEPRATRYIKAMKALIERLIKNRHAYVLDEHVLFKVKSFKGYGKLSHRPLKEMRASARGEVAPKRDPMDFVLWKPSKPGEPSWQSPGRIKSKGRPGWHIECSAMSSRFLGETFDIHGGGIDLVFPHHENERAQSRCVFHTKVMANYWVHNGFLQVEGEKMAKSAGNFVTIHDLLKDWPGEVVRLNMLRTHYRQPMDWTVRGLEESSKILDGWYDIIGDETNSSGTPDADFVSALCDDLNTPNALTQLHRIAGEVRGSASGLAQIEIKRTLRASGLIVGLMAQSKRKFMQAYPRHTIVDEAKVVFLIEARKHARAAKNFAESDRIRDELAAMGVVLKDSKDGTTWEIAR